MKKKILLLVVMYICLILTSEITFAERPKIWINTASGNIFNGLVQNLYPFYETTYKPLYPNSPLPGNNATYIDNNVELVVLAATGSNNINNLPSANRTALKNAVQYNCVGLVSSTGSTDASVLSSLWGVDKNTTDIVITNVNITINRTTHVTDWNDMFTDNIKKINQTATVATSYTLFMTLDLSDKGNFDYLDALYTAEGNYTGTTPYGANIIIAGQVGCGRVYEIIGGIPYATAGGSGADIEIVNPLVLAGMKWVNTLHKTPDFYFSDKQYVTYRYDDWANPKMVSLQNATDFYNVLMRYPTVPHDLGIVPTGAGDSGINGIVVLTNNLLSNGSEIFQHGTDLGHYNIRGYATRASVKAGVAAGKSWIEGNYSGQRVYSFLPPYGLHKATTVGGVVDADIPIYLDGEDYSGYGKIGYNDTVVGAYATTTVANVENEVGYYRMIYKVMQNKLVGNKPVGILHHNFGNDNGVIYDNDGYLLASLSFTTNYSTDKVKHISLNDMAVGRGYRILYQSGSNTTWLGDRLAKFYKNIYNLTQTELNFTSAANGTYMLKFNNTISCVTVNDNAWYLYNNSFVQLPYLTNNTNYKITITEGNNAARIYDTSGVVFAIGTTLTHHKYADMVVLLPDWRPHYSVLNGTKKTRYFTNITLTELNITINPTSDADFIVTGYDTTHERYNVTIATSTPQRININLDTMNSSLDIWDRTVKKIVSRDLSSVEHLFTNDTALNVFLMSYFKLNETKAKTELYDIHNNAIDTDVNAQITTVTPQSIKFNSSQNYTNTDWKIYVSGDKRGKIWKYKGYYDSVWTSVPDSNISFDGAYTLFDLKGINVYASDQSNELYSGAGLSIQSLELKPKPLTGKETIIYVNVKNDGTLRINRADVAIYINRSMLYDTQHVTLDSGKNATLKFSWYPGRNGYVVINATVASVAGETDLSDNSKALFTKVRDIMPTKTMLYNYSVSGYKVTFKANLSDEDGDPVAGQRVYFYNERVTQGYGLTDSNGITIKTLYLSGPHEISAKFQSKSGYAASTSNKVLVDIGDIAPLSDRQSNMYSQYILLIFAITMTLVAIYWKFSNKKKDTHHAKYIKQKPYILS